MQRLKIRDFGTEVQGVELRGDKRNPEPESFRVAFPGGDVDVVRCTDGSYWVHVRVDDRADGDDDKPLGKLVDGRLDIRGKHTSLVNHGDMENPGLYHLAVRVARR